jgi:alkylation response protein AidB-like acyl-CoA dehydrogenase
MRWLGATQRSLELMMARALDRETRGKKLAEFGTIQNWIAEATAELHGFKLMTLHAAWMVDNGMDARKELSMIKFLGANVMLRTIDNAIQAHGALGYSADSPLESWYRMLRSGRLVDGADEVHKFVVARTMLNEFGKDRDTRGGVPRWNYN